VTESSSSNPDTHLESVDAGLALFDGRLQGLVALVTPDERPLQGLAGFLDWRFQGAISRCLQQGFLKGGAGECAYVPLSRNGVTYHLLLVGADSRGPLPADSLKNLKKNLSTLKLSRIGVSRSDCAGTQFKGIPVCIVR
jgi:hypothetical protein